MAIDLARLRAMVRISLSCEPEDIPYEGNASAIDEGTDRDTEAWIRDQLDRGNQWAWCCAVVRVSYEDLTETVTLGGCSYESEDSFREGGQFDELVSEALEMLAAHLDRILTAVEREALAVVPRRTPEGV